MSNQLIPASYNDAITISFTSNAWFNATTVAKNFGKRPVEWLRLDSTIEYINNLIEIQKCDNPTFDKNQLVVLKKGNPENGGGSWLHPKLAIRFAQWLDAKFAVWCDMQIEKILHPVLLLEPPTITKAQQGDIYNKVKLIAGNNHKAIPALWSRFHHQFNINSYKELPASKYNAAIEYIDFLNQQYNDGVEMLFISSVELEKLVKERIALLPSPELTRESVLAMIDEKLKLIPESLPEIEIPTKTYNQDARQCIDLLRKTKLTYQQQELVDHLERCTISAWTHFDEMVPRLRMCADLAMRWRGTPYSIAA